MTRKIENAGEGGVNFVDEKTRVGWEAVKAAEDVAKYLLPEGPSLDAEPIYFDKLVEHKGLSVVFTQGTSVATAEKGLLVPRRTRIILDVLKIPYYMGPPPRGDWDN